MRRIIERTVTIVTTTIWRISWQEDGLPADPQADPDLEASSIPGARRRTVHHGRSLPARTRAKEVEAAKDEFSNQTAEVSPPNQNSYPSMKGDE